MNDSKRKKKGETNVKVYPQEEAATQKQEKQKQNNIDKSSSPLWKCSLAYLSRET